MREDIWSRWLLKNRFAGSEKQAERMLAGLRKVRDHVLDNTGLQPADVLLDVGCGDGLIGFGALERLPEGRVVLSDISRPLLQRCRQIATESGTPGRVDLVTGAADCLPLGDASVDVVTTRSVLIYVDDKASAFSEFHRVLRPGGRISLFEPINSYEVPGVGRFGPLLPGDSPVADLRTRIRDFYERLQPRGTDPMLDFDEKDLLRLAHDAGFREVHLELRADLQPVPAGNWESYIGAPGNPRIPALREAMEQIFRPDEAARYEAYMRPIIENGGVLQGLGAVAYLFAKKLG